MMHADVWYKISNFLYLFIFLIFFGEGEGLHKTIWIPFFIPHVTFWMVP